jgi:hypothetical protein
VRPRFGRLATSVSRHGLDATHTTAGTAVAMTSGADPLREPSPSLEVLALALLLLIGMTLIPEGFGQKIPKGTREDAPGRLGTPGAPSVLPRRLLRPEVGGVPVALAAVARCAKRLQIGEIVRASL